MRIVRVVLPLLLVVCASSALAEIEYQAPPGWAMAQSTDEPRTVTFTSSGVRVDVTFFPNGKEGTAPALPRDGRHVTTGMRRWPSGVMVYSILSKDLESAEYRQALELVRSGFREVGSR